MTREYLPTYNDNSVHVGKKKCRDIYGASKPKPICFISGVVKWGGVYSVAIRSKSKKGGRVSSNTEDIPERVDTSIGGSNNARALSAALTHRWTCVGAKCNKGDLCGIVCIIVT